MGKHRIPFAGLGKVHAFEGRIEDPSQSGFESFFGGPRLLTRYEVYSRVRGEPLVIAHFFSKAGAKAMASELNTLITNAL